MSERSRNAVTTTLQLTCLLLGVLGLVVGLSGVYLLMKYWQGSLCFSNAYITMPAILTLASAAFLVASGCLGSWLSLRDSICLQGLFVYLLVVVFCLESTATALAYYHSVKLQCCGVHDYRDWLTTSWFNRTGELALPQSCCNSTFLSCNGTVEQQIYKQGCQVKLEKALQFVLRFIIWGLPVVFLVEVVVLIMLAQLMRERPFMEYQILGKN
ncbi:tetraspanin 37 isoform X2 [Pleuronectes platessa]|uniref:tetraspanin 37 isoform X2 n=1 Tax=Pleuronectes platessa TaxID=8262 RepID=UPI00232A330E|nr:tetraspanin 37 isoform X2 [Pleuronectes platessa]